MTYCILIPHIWLPGSLKGALPSSLNASQGFDTSFQETVKGRSPAVNNTKGNRTFRDSGVDLSVSMGQPNGTPTPFKSKGQFSDVAWLMSFRTELQKVVDSGKCRVLTLKEVREVVLQLFDTKQAANAKAMKGVPNCVFEVYPLMRFM